jgi:hypothetical protein
VPWLVVSSVVDSQVDTFNQRVATVYMVRALFSCKLGKRGLDGEKDFDVRQKKTTVSHT